MIGSVLGTRVFGLLSLLLLLGSCATTNLLSPKGDATSHGLVVFDGIVKRGYDNWSLLQPASGATTPGEDGGLFTLGFMRAPEINLATRNWLL